jgi:hypothetical protein
MTDTRGRRRPAAAGMADLIGLDAEVRCSAGQVYRGTLRSVDADYLGLERASDGRAVLVARSAVVAVVDELAPGLRPTGRKSAEAALGDGEA